MSDERRKLLRVGDQVRLRDSVVQARGIIVDEFGDDHFSVKWHDVEKPTTHHRGSLEGGGLCSIDRVDGGPPAMIERGPATGEEMVLGFLRAEIESPRYRDQYAAFFRAIGANTTELLERADLQNLQQNNARNSILRMFRGYGEGVALFQGFPDDATWRRITVTPAQIRLFRYANHPVWIKLTGGTRLVADGVTNLGKVQIGEGTSENVRGIARRLERGERFPPLIAVQNAITADMILVEGHTRATAYALSNSPNEIDVLLGTSSGMARWLGL